MHRIARTLALCTLLAVIFATPAGAQHRAAPSLRLSGSGGYEAALAYVEQAIAVGDYLVWQAEQDKILVMLGENEAFLASLYTPPVAVASSSTYSAPARSSGSVGDCSGFSVPDYIIQRESGGDPNAVNPSSGAYGCTQTLPSHYNAGGACAGLNMYSVDGQRQCTAILSNNGTNLQPWAF